MATVPPSISVTAESAARATARWFITAISDVMHNPYRPFGPAIYPQPGGSVSQELWRREGRKSGMVTMEKVCTRSRGDAESLPYRRGRGEGRTIHAKPKRREAAKVLKSATAGLVPAIISAVSTGPSERKLRLAAVKAAMTI